MASVCLYLQTAHVSGARTNVIDQAGGVRFPEVESILVESRKHKLAATFRIALLAIGLARLVFPRMLSREVASWHRIDHRSRIKSPELFAVGCFARRC
jgi:hypothetical protein